MATWPMAIRGHAHARWRGEVVQSQPCRVGVLAAYVDRSKNPKDAMRGTVVFSTAWLAGCTWWLYISMHTYGGMPPVLAASAVVLLAAALSWIYGAAMWLLKRTVSTETSVLVRAMAFGAAWGVAEWLRGTVATGFPWGAVGYAHVDGALRHFAPWVGVYGLSAMVAALAMLIGAQRLHREKSSAPAQWGVWSLALVWALVWWQSPSQTHAWRVSDWPAPAKPTDNSLRISLLQGNVPQELKFGSAAVAALQDYRAKLLQEPADLVVTPETALTFLPEQIPAEYWRPLRATQDRALLLGLPMRADRGRGGYTNSVLGLAPEQPSDYRYDKHHLVPFGEFVPPLFQWFVDWMHIPLGDFARGPLAQAPFEWRGQRISVNICFEDLFGEELAQTFTDPARAPLELGRPMLRATNTGATALIDAKGDVLHKLPYDTEGALRVEVRGLDGALTPYAWWVTQWGLWPFVAAMACLWAWAARMSHHARHGQRRFGS